MDPAAVDRMLGVQQALTHDPQYLALHGEYRHCHRRLLALLETLPQSQAAVIGDYLGVSAAMHLRMLELACAP